MTPYRIVLSGRKGVRVAWLHRPRRVRRQAHDCRSQPVAAVALVRGQGAVACAADRRPGWVRAVVVVRVCGRTGQPARNAEPGGGAGRRGARRCATDRRLRQPDRQRPATGRETGGAVRSRRPAGAPAARRPVPAARVEERAPPARGDQHPGRRRSAGRCARLRRIPARQARAPAARAEVRGAGAGRFELPEILRSQPQARRAPGRTGRDPMAGARRCRPGYRGGGQSLGRTGADAGPADTQAARVAGKRDGVAPLAQRAGLDARATLRRRTAGQPAHHRTRQFERYPPPGNFAGRFRPVLRAGRCAWRVAAQFAGAGAPKCSAA